MITILIQLYGVRQCPPVVFQVLTLHSDENTFHQARYQAISHFQNVLSAETLPSFIILDDLFYLRSMRREIYKICRDFRVQLAIIHVDTPLSTAIEHNQLRSLVKQVPVEVNQEFILPIS